ncbi:MAG TPA: hypothetical protein VFH73_01295, partial [Polyangia bacterium]|nr:hypothetical protein [Polyangia bacterium]
VAQCRREGGEQGEQYGDIPFCHLRPPPRRAARGPLSAARIHYPFRNRFRYVRGETFRATSEETALRNT